MSCNFDREVPGEEREGEESPRKGKIKGLKLAGAVRTGGKKYTETKTCGLFWANKQWLKSSQQGSNC